MIQKFFAKRRGSLARSSRKGLSLLEVIVAIAVFTIIMIATVEVFSSMIKTKAEADRMRESHQKAQVAIETITKSIRSGVVVSPASSVPITNDSDTIRIYDYSQLQCIEYSFSSDALQKKFVIMDYDDRADCSGSPSFSGLQTMVDATTKGTFDISWETDNKYVTIALLLIAPNLSETTNQTRVQTTVSMRNLK